MRAQFNWKVDEELGGEGPDLGAGPPHSRRLFWGLLLLGVAIAALLYWQQARRLHLQEEALEEEISASFLLWHSAITNHDQELFLLQLSNRHSAWLNTQRALFNQERILQRPDLGLQLLPGVPEITGITLSPDWQSAALTAEFAYRPLAPGGGNTIHLQRAFLLQKQNDRWLLVPGDGEFWGAQQRANIQGLTLYYPQRDERFAERLAQDLWDDLSAICQGASGTPDTQSCLRDLQLTVRLERDDALLAALVDTVTPVFRNGDFVLPAPTLAGAPRDDEAYETLYDAYTQRILNSTRQNLSPPLALPRQALNLLCFPAAGRTLQLFRYDARADDWSTVFEHRPLRYLIPGPQGDGVIFQEFTRGAEATRLRLYWLREGREQQIYDREMLEQTTRPAGWSGADRPHLLLQGFSSAGTSAQHRWLDLENCGPDGCAVVDLPGYTVWSPNGEHTLILKDQALWRGDGAGEPLAVIGVGLSPFWIDNNTFGYVRYDREAGAPSMQIATAEVGRDLPNIVLPVQQLSEMLDPHNPPLLFINYVTVNPGDREQLLLSATTVGYASAKYNMFSLSLATGNVRLLQQFERLPTGYPSLLTPAGYPPFRLSPDGRWLLVTLLAATSPTRWAFHLYDLQQNRSLVVNAAYPEYPAQFPFYDWTADGRWLAIVERGYVRLIAPEFDYQKLVAHREDECFYPVWTQAPDT